MFLYFGILKNSYKVRFSFKIPKTKKNNLMIYSSKSEFQSATAERNPARSKQIFANEKRVVPRYGFNHV
ncbi:hypothetical protein CRE_00591 [Caenorhabditis remanei]|uniref:Uncharacterized protein n=1 Tax=Caenorhabditis remanei TaxID=31234 RepID=E3LDB5_CAERE|nr:hypothetical protein CRE_00591 [Caenorhabditis remanei]